MSTAPAWFNSVKNATSLEALREALHIVHMRGFNKETAFDQVLTELPTFGGTAINQEGFYSWDADNALVYGASGWEIQSRADLGV